MEFPAYLKTALYFPFLVNLTLNAAIPFELVLIVFVMYFLPVKTLSLTLTFETAFLVALSLTATLKYLDFLNLLVTFGALTVVFILLTVIVVFLVNESPVVIVTLCFPTARFLRVFNVAVPFDLVITVYFLYFFPDPHGQASFLPIFSSLTTVLEFLKALVNSFLLS